MTQMTVQVVTPDGIKYDHHAKCISVTTPDGEMGILPNHINLIAPLQVHEMKIRRGGEDEKWTGLLSMVVLLKSKIMWLPLSLILQNVTVISMSAEQSEQN